MSLSNDLITEFVKVTNDEEPRKNEATVFGTIVNDGRRNFVQIDGSDAITPITTTATIKPGERVVLSIKNHMATVMGNASDPSASSSEVAHALQRIYDINEDINGIGIKINDMTNEIDGISIKVENQGIEIDQMGIRMEGFVTFTGVADGTTTIDGGCIKTGKIDAERLNLTGAITWNDFTPSLQQDISRIEDVATDAESMADQALVTVSGFTIQEGQETYIDGSMIYSDSIYAGSLHLGGQMTVYKTFQSSTVGGYIGYCTGFNSNRGIGVMNDSDTGQCICTDLAARLSYGGDNQVVCSDGIFLISNTGGIHFKFHDEYYAYMDETCLGPYDSGTMDLGGPNNSWSVVYADTCEGTTSDRNKKNSIEDLPEKYLTLFDNLVPKRFKLNNGRSGRYHVGYVAQEVEEAMKIAGVDGQEFGGFIRDKDKDGNDIYLLRYGEFDGIYASKIKQLENRIAELEAKLS